MIYHLSRRLEGGARYVDVRGLANDVVSISYGDILRYNVK
jgi:hypothetical protein